MLFRVLGETSSHVILGDDEGNLTLMTHEAYEDWPDHEHYFNTLSKTQTLLDRIYYGRIIDFTDMLKYALPGGYCICAGYVPDLQTWFVRGEVQPITDVGL